MDDFFFILFLQESFYLRLCGKDILEVREKHPKKIPNTSFVN